MSQKVTVIGPNLRDQSKGQFIVHAAGCADIARLARREPEVRNAWTISAASLEEIAEEVYADIIEETGETPAAYLSDFHFCPCITLPVQGEVTA